MTILKTRKKERLLLLLLAVFSLCLLLMGPALRSSAARPTGTVKNRILNVRSSASTNSSIVCKLTQGTKVTIISDTTGDDGLKWYDVYFAYNGEAREGFVRADLLNVSGTVSGGSSGSSSGGSSSASGTRYVKPSVAIVRSYASTNADIRTRLNRGSTVNILSSKTGADDGRTWYKVSFTQNGNTVEGYIRGDLLVETNPGGSSSGTTDVSGTRYVNGDVVRVRTWASTNGDIRSRLTRGTTVTLISSKTGDDGQLWYKVSYSDGGYQLSGYIRGDLLSESNSGSSSGSSSGGTASNTPASIRPAVANIRTWASTNGDIRSKLSQGTGVTIIGEQTGSDDGRKWYKISYNSGGVSMTGYIRGDLLNIGSTGNTSSGSSSSGSSSGGSSSAVAQVRTYASPYADIRATLENGTKVAIIKKVTGEDGQEWTKISFTQNGSQLEGYVPSSLLK